MNTPLKPIFQTCQHLSMPVAEGKTWKPWDRQRPYAPCTPRAPKNSDTPWTSTMSKPSTIWEHLTLHNWLGVVQYFDSNQPISQEEVVKHFTGRPDGALRFSQSALSRHLSKKGHEEDQSRLAANPTALLGKKAWIVTWPDGERALVLWVKHMEEKLEHVTRAMLVAKQAKFEDKLGQLKSNGWVQGFCKMWEVSRRLAITREHQNKTHTHNLNTHFLTIRAQGFKFEVSRYFIKYSDALS